jgi:hypothetical protein
LAVGFCQLLQLWYVIGRKGATYALGGVGFHFSSLHRVWFSMAISLAGFFDDTRREKWERRFA